MMVPVPVKISDEQAKAVTALAGIGERVMDLVEPLLKPVAEIVGRGTADALALLGANWLSQARLEQVAVLQHNSAERLRRRGIEPQPVSPTLAIPLLKAAADEDSPELLELWEELLAAAMDPKRARSARRSYVDLLRQMDPLDALAFKLVAGPSPRRPTVREYIAAAAGVGPDQAEVSLQNLYALGVVQALGVRIGQPAAHIDNVDLTALGRELVRVLQIT